MLLPLIADHWFIETLRWLADPWNLLIVIKVAVGIGLVIFVHELGHFLVAKWCGVRVDKFYVGFDVPIKLGWGRWGIPLPAALWKRKWGETEYGIGILPLGGYVKMLGQDDNPSRAAEEIRRAREAGPGEAPAIDPRSYLAKSVPQRMAIISAGVIMNLIFAVVFATIAYAMGVMYVPGVVGNVVPGEPAWAADLRPDDEIVEINGQPNPSFKDLTEHIILGDHSDGLDVKIRRGGEESLVRIAPNQDRTFTLIGIIPPHDVELEDKKFVAKGSAADRAGFRGGDVVVRMAGVPVNTFGDMHRVLAQNIGKPLIYTVRRKSEESSAGSEATEPKLVDLTVDPNPRKLLGVVMEFDTVGAVRENSPAAAAGVKAGDKIIEIDGRLRAQIDPLLLGEELRRRAVDKPDDPLPLVLERDGKRLQLNVKLRNPDWFEYASGHMASAPALGIAYRVSNVVKRIEKELRTGDIDLQAGDVIEKAEIVPVDGKKDDERDAGGSPFAVGSPVTIGDSEKDASWAAFAQRCQAMLPDSQVKLYVRRGGEKSHEVLLRPTVSKNYFNPERGVRPKDLKRLKEIESAADALKAGFKETVSAATVVVKFLKKLRHKPAIATGMGGPVSIAALAGSQAKEGLPQLLLFLTMISANLAVVNFLPIPVLDGGHMVFLLYEGIRGKPPSERVFGVLTMVGFVLLLALMAFVFWLDIDRLVTWIQAL